MDVDDEVVHIPLLTRPLQPPPSAVASGKRVKARIKPGVHRLEVHELGAARVEDDREKNQASAVKDEKDPPRLSEVRLQSEPVHQNGAHMIGIVRNGELHLHPIKETHQFRPTLTYLDYLTNKHRRRGGAGDSDSEDDEPPPDPDEPSSATPQKAAKKLELPEDEDWQDLQYNDMESNEAGDAFENIFSQNEAVLDCHTDVTSYLKSIEGL
ncbi:hypothetical protein BDZ89DRAFT_1089789 [Hymenopellis radicata]|nr:hypothetical protein BDZ89DRAFT_1089789 [Hymenopellis radicata]